MKTEDLMLLGAVAVGVFVVMPILVLRKTANPNRGIVANTYGAQEIPVAGNTNGWRYFTDGTSIDPSGRYYKSGDMVFDPAGMYQ